MLNERRLPRQRMWPLIAGVLGAVIPTRQVLAQLHSFTPTISAGILSQASPLSTEVGYGAGVALPLVFHRHFAVVPGVDFARTHVTDDIAICLGIGPERCLRRPHGESVVSGSLSLAVQPLPTRHLRPTFGAGVVIARSLAPRNQGEVRTFVAPQLDGALHLSTRVGTWSLGARWRLVDRWSPYDATHQTALLLGFRPGRNR